jgi:hypothetical protein
VTFGARRESDACGAGAGRSLMMVESEWKTNSAELENVMGFWDDIPHFMVQRSPLV